MKFWKFDIFSEIIWDQLQNVAKLKKQYFDEKNDIYKQMVQSTLLDHDVYGGLRLNLRVPALVRDCGTLTLYFW